MRLEGASIATESLNVLNCFLGLLRLYCRAVVCREVGFCAASWYNPSLICLSRLHKRGVDMTGK